MGAVYEARHRVMDRRAAIKIPKYHLAQDAGYRNRFATECKAMARLNHRGVARIYEVGEAWPYFAMEFVDGEPLSARLSDQDRRPVAAADVFGWADELLDALIHAHEQGVIHRDLKPDNIMLVARDGATRPVLIDFGMARIAGQATTGFGHGGTLGYAAPEQILDPKSRDARTDVYGAGAIVYALLTGGHTPYAEAFAEVEAPAAFIVACQRVADGRASLTPLRAHAPAVPAAFALAVERALAPTPAARFPTAAEFRAALATGGLHRGADPAPIANSPPAAAPPWPAAAPPEAQGPSASGSSPIPATTPAAARRRRRARAPPRSAPAPEVGSPSVVASGRRRWLVLPIAGLALALALAGVALVWRAQGVPASEEGPPPPTVAPPPPAAAPSPPKAPAASVGYEFVTLPGGTFTMGSASAKVGHAICEAFAESAGYACPDRKTVGSRLYAHAL
mgnify:CR=1 FL=1